MADTGTHVAQRESANDVPTGVASRRTTGPSSSRSRAIRRLVLVACVLALVGVGRGGLGLVSAATLGDLGPGAIGEASTSVVACDQDGVHVGFEMGSIDVAGQPTITGIRVSDVAATCQGQTITVLVHDGSGTKLGQGAAVSTGSETVVPLASTPAAEAVTAVAVVIN